MNGGLIQRLSVLVGVWSIGLLLVQTPLGKVVFAALIAFTVLYGLVVHLHKHDPARLYVWYGRPGSRQFIELTCRWAKLQPPTAKEVKQGGRGEGNPGGEKQQPDPWFQELLLTQDTHFEQLARHLREHVFGHDAAILRLVRSLERNIKLRRRSSRETSLPPLGVYLLAGRTGIGRRYLANLMSRAVYKERDVFYVDLTEFRHDSDFARLFGPAQDEHANDLVHAVRTKPCHAIIVENIELGSTLIVERLARVLKEGSYSTGGARGRVSFSDCVFFLLTTSGSEFLEKQVIPESTEGSYQILMETLVRRAGFPSTVASVVQDAVVLCRPTRMDQARVVLALMAKECARFKLAIDYVDPVVVVDLVAGITEQEGFEHLPPRVSRLLRKPLEKAIRSNRTTVMVK